ncbi:YVTN repeat-like/Quino protein amine dehydrogenase [Lentithecium fluviatile CBS 122367]|uniref:YVTN repeat-like/Quino protein amine dehydrogenase n=1 Tax=Lentithecium fluviatile CBS 122367 TaxID=1168545 RepID=A0A6G1INY3_9PLEO|nr:YVTN repeat-like/Quino protein amine dehydrogenase [Lentithecium fluviatile CBS 122367]
MLFTTLVVSLGLLQASALTVPTRSHGVREVAVAAAAAIPTLTLLSDFQKDNVTASWAPGHPKVWGQAEKKFSIPTPPLPAGVDAVFTEDGKFLLLTNVTDTDVIRLDTGAVVSTLKLKFPSYGTHTSVSAAPGGEYDFLVAASNFTWDDKVTQQRLSQDGVPVGPSVDRPGFFSNGGFDPTVVDGDGKRVLLAIDIDDVHVYDLDDVNSSVVTLTGHTDSIQSIVFSPDKKTIASTGFDGHVKLWDAATGTLVHDIPPEDPEQAPDYQNWLTRFSPDGKTLLYSIGSPLPEVKLVQLNNLTDVVTLGPFSYWVRSAEWNSDGSLLALGGFPWLLVLRSSDLAVVQEWRVDTEHWEEVLFLHWFDKDTKLRWSYLNGTEMYDFEKNLKYRWGPDEDDVPPPGWVVLAGDWFPFKSEGWFGNFDSDSSVRVWSLPE